MLRRSRVGWMGISLAMALVLQAVAGAQVGDLSRRRPATAPATAPTVGPGTFESAEHRFRVAYSARWMTETYDSKAGTLLLRPVDVRRDENRVLRPNWLVTVAPIAPVPEAERSLDGLVSRRMARLKDQFEGAEFTEVTDVTLGGTVPGKRFEHSGTFKGLKMRGETTLAVKGEVVFFLLGYASALEYEVIAPEFDALRASFTWTDGEAKTEEKKP